MMLDVDSPLRFLAQPRNSPTCRTTSVNKLVLSRPFHQGNKNVSLDAHSSYAFKYAALIGKPSSNSPNNGPSVCFLTSDETCSVSSHIQEVIVMKLTGCHAVSSLGLGKANGSVKFHSLIANLD